MAAFRGYVDNIALQSADRLLVHRTEGARVVVIEYEVHGTILATGVTYDNRFCSIIEIENRKIAHWRDYMDSPGGVERIDRAGSLRGGSDSGVLVLARGERRTRCASRAKRSSGPC